MRRRWPAGSAVVRRPRRARAVAGIRRSAAGSRPATDRTDARAGKVEDFAKKIAEKPGDAGRARYGLEATS